MMPAIRFAFLSVAMLPVVTSAQVPQRINYQGRVSVGTVNFQGTGKFRFALVNETGSEAYWTNSPDAAPADGIPDEPVSLNVEKGLYSVQLGDTSMPKMASLPTAALNHADVRLRVWFDDGEHGVQLLSPDQRFAAVGYALIAGDVPNGSITGSKIANAAITGDHISPGTITADKLAPDAIPGGNLGPGSIGAMQLADGAVSFAKLAKPPQSGSFDASSLPLGETVPFSITFPQPYQTAPVVTASLAANLPTCLKGLSINVGKVTATGFAGTVEKLPSEVGVTPFVYLSDTTDVPALSIAEIAGEAALVFQTLPAGELRYCPVKSDTNADFTTTDPIVFDSAAYPSLEEVNGHPAVSFNKQGVLAFLRATQATGTWPSEPVTVSTGGTYLQTRLAVISGRPAIAYVGAGVGFVRAEDVNGDSWDSPIIVDSSSNGLSPSLAEVDGYPAICYVDSTTFALKYVRATNAEGTQWGSPITVSGSGAHHYPSLKVVQGRPAICFYNGASLKYVRADNAAGTTWPAAVIVDTENGEYCSLEIIDGRPAIAYQDLLRKDLRYARASNAEGSAWKTPITLDSAGDAGTLADMASVNGVPVIVTSALGTNQAVRIYRPIVDYRINWIALPE